MELENTFYIIGIICMSLITLILIGLIVIALVIKAKIAQIQHSIQDKVRPFSQFVNKAEAAVENAANKVSSTAQKITKK